MEKEGYWEALGMLREMYPGRMTISIKEAAAATGSSIGTVYGATKRVKKPLPSKKLGGKVVIPITQLARWMCGN